MSRANILKLERDGHLWFGKPDVRRKRIEACITNGHAGHGCLEYADGVCRCLGCLTDFIPARRSPAPPEETPKA